MMKEKASVEASLHVSKQEKEATAALKEAAIYEETAAELDALDELQDLVLDDPMKRTKDYIKTQPFDIHATQELQVARPLAPIVHHATVNTQPSSNNAHDSLYESLKEKNERRSMAAECYGPSPDTKIFLSNQKFSPDPNIRSIIVYPFHHLPFLLTLFVPRQKPAMTPVMHLKNPKIICNRQEN